MASCSQAQCLRRHPYPRDAECQSSSLLPRPIGGVPLSVSGCWVRASYVPTSLRLGREVPRNTGRDDQESLCHGVAVMTFVLIW